MALDMENTKLQKLWTRFANHVGITNNTNQVSLDNANVVGETRQRFLYFCIFGVTEVVNLISSCIFSAWRNQIFTWNIYNSLGMYYIFVKFPKNVY